MLAFQLYTGYADHFVVVVHGQYHIGDLIIYQDQYYLIIAAIADDDKYEMIDSSQTHVVYANFVTPSTLVLIHWMVSYRYSTYHKVLPLFIPAERSLMSKYSYAKPSKPSHKPRIYQKNHSLIQFDQKIKGQQLVVMPDLWTMTAMIDIDHLANGSKILYSTMTHQQKIHTYRKIKYGILDTLICTHSQIFQDWKSLHQILIIDPHKRYYKNTHSPKYDTMQVVKHMADLYHADLQIGSVFPLSFGGSL